MSNELRDKIRAAWPEYAKTHGRQDPDFYIPPVREGGNTAALIDLAVQLADEHYARPNPEAQAALDRLTDQAINTAGDAHGRERVRDDWRTVLKALAS